MMPDALHECLVLSFANTPFPVVAAKLATAGVVSYRTDLIRLEKLYYGQGHQSHREPLPLDHPPEVAAAFDREAVAAAARAIQQGHLGYAEFLRRIMAAGCSSYAVFLRGRQVIYSGRDGAQLLEAFPVIPSSRPNS